ncbi:MAG: hybrid sensor histidine kinase/response regulator, partial [Acidiferrobacteraceae bacterium]
EDFAAILLDVQMPGLDGFETAALIHRRKQSRHIPIIFITAISKEESYVFRGYARGAVDYIFKPFDPDILRAKVSVFAELERKNRQIRRQAEQILRSEKKERERQLLELRERSDRRYHNLADSMPQLVWVTNEAGAITYWNRRWLEYVGDASGSHGDDVLTWLVHPDDLARMRQLVGNRDAMGLNSGIEARLRKGGGSEYYWHLVQVLAEDPVPGEPAGLLVTATNIHERKQIEQELARGREQLAITLRCIGDGVITADVHGRVTLMNKAAEQLTEWSQEDAIGHPLEEVFPVGYFGGRKPVADTAAGETVKDPVLDVENVRLRTRSGRERLIAKKVAPILGTDENPAGVVVVFQDITEKQRIAEEQQKASRLESIGVLAGSIAHDFNNILTAIMGNISLAKFYSGAGDHVHERLAEAEKAALWARDLTQQLLTFAKGGSPIRKTIDIASVVRSAAEFASRGSPICCEFGTMDSVLTDADESQIRQVIHNLVLNAQQATTNGASIRISVRKVKTRRNELPLPAGEYVEISCRDQGVGISQENLAKIFDPYFTTKPKGTGLGLATSYSIVKRHDGLIRVESNIGQGTCFSILLPVSQGTSAPEPALPEGARAAGRVLVMDDEGFIRDLLRRLLTHFGYEGEFAQDGREALELYVAARERGQPFDVVIMDLVIPGGMGGQEAVKHLLAVDPDARVIVSSGYSNDPVMANFRHYGFCDAVAKPYKNDELRQVIARAAQPQASLRSTARGGAAKSRTG